MSWTNEHHRYLGGEAKGSLGCTHFAMTSMAGKENRAGRVMWR